MINHSSHLLTATVFLLSGFVLAGEAQPAPAAQQSPAAQTDLAAMQGTWALMSWQDDGYELTAHKGPATLTVEGDRFTYRIHGSGPMHDQARMVLDPERQPRQLSVFEKQRDPAVPTTQRNGAYRIDGDELRMTLNMKSDKAVSLALDNSRQRPGVPKHTMIDGLAEESDKLYVAMREEGYTEGSAAALRGLSLVPHHNKVQRPIWLAGADGGEISAPGAWQRLRFWFTAADPEMVAVDLGGGVMLQLGAIDPAQVAKGPQKRSDIFRYPWAKLGDQVGMGEDVPYRANAANQDKEPFWICCDLRRRDGELRVWATGQTVMTAKVAAAPATLRIVVKPGVHVRELRWLAADTGTAK